MKTNTDTTLVAPQVQENTGYIISIEKIKKQAKRLLKLQETNPNIKINSLAQSQEILSHIYGWENWYAFEKYLSGIKTKPAADFETPQPHIDISLIQAVTKIDDLLQCMEHSTKTYVQLSGFEYQTIPKQKHIFIQKQKDKPHLVTGIQIKGSKSLTISKYYADFISSYQNHQNCFEHNGISLYFVVKSFKNNKKIIEETLQHNNIFDLQFLFDDKINTLSSWVHQEEHYLFISQTFENENIDNNFQEHKNTVQSVVQKLSELSLKTQPLLATQSIKILKKDKEISSKIKNNIKELQHLPWTQSSVLFRTPNGQLMPYQPSSTLQTGSIDLIYAKPGSGKSVLMNTLNLGFCLNIAFKELPQMAIIDIGPSSLGFVSLLKEALPVSQQHLVVYKKLKMKQEESINPFDTQLGCRHPSKTEKYFLVNFLSLLGTELHENVPMTGMYGLVNNLIDEVYKKKSDFYEPQRYVPFIETEVDRAIKATGMPIDANTTWWEVVDYLFNEGAIQEAQWAQRHASPLLIDFIHMAKNEKIQSVFKITAPTGEFISDSLVRMLTNALTHYPILSQPTKLDLGDAKIIALDLDDVSKGGGVFAERMAPMMYMLARQISAKAFYPINADLDGIPAAYPDYKLPSTTPKDKYQKFHQKRIEKTIQTPKRICYEEYHRVSKLITVRDQILADMKEGKKWNIDVVLTSQSLEDFEHTMVEFATSIFVMDGGNQQYIDKIGDIFGFNSSSEKHALQHKVHGPKRGGGTCLAKFATVEGWHTSLLTLTLSPMELWSFTQTHEDIALKNVLMKKVGFRKTIELLAQKYPNGSCKATVYKIKESQDNFNFMDTISWLADQILQNA